jgi:hypothetical protein
LVGEPQHPESLILFAPQGYGKTSHRLEIARLAGERREAPALTVMINDFSLLLDTSIENLTLDNYITVIRQATLEALDIQITASPVRQMQLQQNARIYARFCALLQLYVPLRVLERAMPESLADVVRAYERSRLGPKAWLNELHQLARQVGYASVYVLLDGIDELNLTRDKPEVMFQLLSPLLDAPGLLQECGFAFKFFLPEAVEEQMKQRRIGRLDRIPHRSLHWTVEQLREMLAQRLVSYSLMSATNPFATVRRFSDLCDTEQDVDGMLSCAAHSSPRLLINLAREIIERHCQSTGDTEKLIQISTVERVLAQTTDHDMAPEPRPPIVEQVLAQTTDHDMAPEPRPPIAVAHSEQTADRSGQRTALLFLDERGDVWLDNRRLDVDLSKNLRICLEHLWANRHRKVGYDELQQALYGATIDDRGDPRSSLDKLVRRLRATLEPGRQGSRVYVDVLPGFGYVLRNFRDHQ